MKILALAAALVALTASPIHAADTQQAEMNKKTVLEFYEKGLNQKDFEAASRYFGPRYTQHNPNAADGPEGFKAFLQFLREKFPNSHSEIKRVLVDGDYVILHVHAVREPGTRGAANSREVGQFEWHVLAGEGARARGCAIVRDHDIPGS